MDLSDLPRPPWLDDLERSTARLMASLRPYHEAMARALTPPAWLQEIERSTAYLKKFQPHQEMLDRLAPPKELAGYDKIAKHFNAQHEQLTKQTDAGYESLKKVTTAVGADYEALAKVSSTARAGYESLAHVTSTSRLLDDMLRAAPSLEPYRTYLDALNQAAARPFFHHLAETQTPAFAALLREAQPTLSRAEARDVEQALSQESQELAETLTAEDHVSALQGMLVLRERLQQRFPKLGEKLFAILLMVFSLIYTTVESRKAERRSDARHDRDMTELRREIRKAQPTPTQKLASRSAVVRHAVPLRANHSDHSRVLARLARGQRVTILARGRDWAQVETRTGTKTTKGWVRTKYLRKAS
jgi:hypothetical protein